ncbi:hypothetical protein [Dyella terrae]|nr:hypothetical protein [Dyella terrae]ULU23683.1 hypothetical protein DYST_00581 [Dyella terrae]
MKSLIAGKVSSAETVKLIGEGWELHCPICNATVKTVPEHWVKGTPPTWN